ncbi:MAG: DEAD/DEAH box helicase [Clostridia bacterium]|jgi:ATP-dependent RNA helicase DeaD|nr:DEAD/DEAH box helicase [Clostridia bacterium]
MEFKDLQCSEDTKKALAEMGIVTASPIQEKAIPVIMEGKDVLGLAQTGTGKTAAFVIPVIEKVEAGEKYPQVIIVCPTRELALQVTDEVEKMIKYHRGVTSITVYGGAPIQRQIQKLKRGPQFVVGTPGRILDLIRRKALKLGMVNTVILDEADEMLNMGFKEDIETILENVDDNRQTLLFSATMSKQIKAITNRYLDNPERIEIKRKEVTSKNIDQKFIKVNEKDKIEVISRLMEVDDPNLSIVFCNTKRSVDEVVGKLQKKGYICDRIHGDIKQEQRTVVMERFRNGHMEILVATDVMARGIDVDGVETVFNYDVPQENEYYVHRIGRTGRAGNKGTSYTLVNNREKRKLQEITKYIKTDIAEVKAPSIDKVKKVKLQKFVANLEKELENKAELNEYIEFLQTTDLAKHNVYEIVAAFFKNEISGKFLADISDVNSSRDRGRDSRGSRDRGRDSRGSRRESGSRRSRSNGDMTRMFITLGSRDNIRKGDIVGAVADKSNITGDMIGDIEILKNFSFVEIEQGAAEKVLKAMDGNTIKGKKVNFEISTGKKKK